MLFATQGGNLKKRIPLSDLELGPNYLIVATIIRGNTDLNQYPLAYENKTLHRDTNAYKVFKYVNFFKSAFDKSLRIFLITLIIQHC